jgi:hypothetical protein
MWKNINHLINKKSKSSNISSLQIEDQAVSILLTLDLPCRAKSRKLMSILRHT